MIRDKIRDSVFTVVQKADFIMLNIDSDRSTKQKRLLFCREKATSFLSASNSCYDVYVLLTLKKKSTNIADAI